MGSRGSSSFAGLAEFVHSRGPRCLSGEVPGPSLASSLSGLEAAPGPGPALLEYWIGADDLLRRGARVVLEGGLPGIEFSRLEVEVRFHGYGGEVNIPVPEAAVPGGGPGGSARVWVSLACDRFLREELVFRADADTAARMDRVVEVVRSSHQGECGSGWRPVAVDPGPWGACFGAPGERGSLVGEVPWWGRFPGGGGSLVGEVPWWGRFPGGGGSLVGEVPWWGRFRSLRG